MAVIAEGAVDLSRLLDERAISPLQALVAALSGLIMLVDGYDIQVMALAVPSIAQQWSIAPSHFGLALSAALLGLSVGAAFIAPLGDRLGRRTLLIGAMAAVGATTMATSTAASPMQFVVWRFATGVGLGVSIPNCNAWTAEYVPLRSRATILVVMNAAIGAGAFCAGFVAPVIFAHWGWRGAFVIGGASPLLIGLAILAVAPESLKFLALRRPRDPRIPAILARIAPDIDPAGALSAPARARGGSAPQSPERTRWSLLDLLGPLYRRRTLVLWTVVGLNLFVMYVLISWLPTLLHADGWALADAQRGAVLIQAGGVIGGVLLSLFVNRGRTLPALLVAFALTAACLALFRFTSSGASWLFIALMGAGTSGSQLSLNALSTAYYPPAIKASGMSWAGVIGNIAAFLAPLAAAWAMNAGVSPVDILAMLAIPALACAAGATLMRAEWQWN
jgi:MFS transporter, AAHS family, 4-hydroxybenzoate transporter